SFVRCSMGPDDGIVRPTATTPRPSGYACRTTTGTRPAPPTGLRTCGSIPPSYPDLKANWLALQHGMPYSRSWRLRPPRRTTDTPAPAAAARARRPATPPSIQGELLPTSPAARNAGAFETLTERFSVQVAGEGCGPSG